MAAALLLRVQVEPQLVLVALPRESGVDVAALSGRIHIVPPLKTLIDGCHRPLVDRVRR